MSIQSEINRISGNVSDALDAIEDKGVTIPSGANSDDLADLIAQITGGGGVGGITQDQDGYLVLSPDAPSPAPSGGLEFEAGTWTPSEDIAKHSILFADTHTEAPFYYMITDAEDDYSGTTSSAYFVSYNNFHQLTGVAHNADNTGTYYYGYVHVRSRNSATGFTGSTFLLITPYTSSVKNSNICSQFWATETEIVAFYNNTVYWRSGRTYKWIAVWAPTT